MEKFPAFGVARVTKRVGGSWHEPSATSNVGGRHDVQVAQSELSTVLQLLAATCQLRAQVKFRFTDTKVCSSPTEESGIDGNWGIVGWAIADVSSDGRVRAHGQSATR